MKGFRHPNSVEGPSAEPARAAEPQPCDPAIILRALVFVQGVLLLAVVAVAPGPGQVWEDAAGAAAQSLPTVLAWILAACGLQRAGWRLFSRATVLLLQAWAALCAAVVSYWWQLGMVGEASWWRIAVAGLIAAVLSATFTGWLRARSRRLLPAAHASRLIELQARIRPHFLFNTLNTALALVRVEPAKAETLLENLAELFRAGLGPKDDLLPSTLEEELALARRYVEIEQLRFGPRLRVTWDLDPAAGAAAVPRLMLQPLLENAVRHGVEPAPQGGEIVVTTRARHGVVWVVLYNSVPQEPSVPGQGMALDNVRERLSLMHDLAADLRTARDDGSFQLEITLPAVAGRALKDRAEG